MQIPVTSKIYVFTAIDGPSGVDVTQYAPQIALVADDGREPGPGDWHSASWIGGQAALLVGPGGGVVYPAGAYMMFATLAAGVEAPVMQSGRVRIGDTRP